MSDGQSKDELVNLSNDELVEISNQMKERVRNEDWHRVVHDLQVSGHIHTYRESAPLLLQRFLRLEVDLDQELAKQSAAAPLMSSLSLKPSRPRGNEKNMVGIFSSQDAGANMQCEYMTDVDLTVIAFSIQNMLTLKFRLPRLDKDECHSFLDMMRRDQGLSILWTRERWEHDFLIFIKQEFYTRVYAFSESFHATARLTNEVTGNWLDWIERCWMPRDRRRNRVKRTTQTINVLELSNQIPELAPAAQLSPTATQEIPVVKIFKPTSEEEILAQVIELLLSLDAPSQMAMLAVEADFAPKLRPIFEHINNAETVNQDELKALLTNDADLLERLKEKITKSTRSDSPKPEAVLAESSTNTTEDDKFVW